MGAKDWLLLFLALNSTFSARADACVSLRGIVGTCLPLNQCAALSEILTRTSSFERADFFKTLRCSKRSYVCCPDEDPYSEPPPSVEGHPNLHLLPRPSQCASHRGGNRIIGGQQAPLLTYTWMALIAFDEENIRETVRDFSCGGSIINNRYILTAAHCISKLQKKKLAGVRVGEHDISKDEDCYNNGVCSPQVQDFLIEKVIPHPRFIGMTAAGTNLEHDIGLLRLAEPIDLTQMNTKPTCLPVSEELREYSLEKNSLILTGWGRTNMGDNGELLDDDKRQSSVLLYANLPIVSNKLCAENYNGSGIGGIGFRHFCAGGANGVNSCTGDSGGPAGQWLVVGEKYKFVQYGVVSAGSAGCASEDKPSIFTNVLYYMDWILDQLEP